MKTMAEVGIGVILTRTPVFFLVGTSYVPALNILNKRPRK